MYHTNLILDKESFTTGALSPGSADKLSFLRTSGFLVANFQNGRRLDKRLKYEVLVADEEDHAKATVTNEPI